MTIAASWTLGRRPELDGVRGIAMLLVLVGHTGFYAPHTASRVGVTVFFTLSGFLITALLIQEQERTSRISLRGFWARRALRLVPALGVFLASMAFVSAYSDKSTAPRWDDYVGAIFYVANYVIPLQGRDNVILHTWSLSVEEQFYIVWPLVLVLVLRKAGRRDRATLMAVAVAGVLTANILRLALWDGGEGWRRIYYGTDTRMDGLLIGCLLAIHMTSRPPGRNRRAVALTCLALLAALSLGRGHVEYLVVPAAVPLVTAGLVWAITQQRGSGILTSASLRYVGRRSYALYLWHFPLFGVAATLAVPLRWPALVIAAALTFALAELSWRCVEEPFVQLKTRWAPQPKINVDNSVEGLATSKTSL